MRILIADDDQDIRMLLGRMLEGWDHEVLSVSNGQEALSALENDSISLVISDWMMPEMDGPELCRRIRAANLGRYVYIILLTARDAKNDLIHGMEAGADDFVTKPFNKGELNMRIRAGERILMLEKDLEDRNNKLTDTNAQLSKAYDQINKDLEAGAEMQRSLLPRADFKLPGFNISWIFCPSRFVAGDIFNLFQLDEHHIGFYLLDVAGHGVPSAMLSVTLSRFLTPILDSPLKYRLPNSPGYLISEPKVVLSELNERFQVDEDTMQYFTMVYGMININEQKLSLAHAGHPPPIHLPRDGDIKLLGSGSLPIGILPAGDYETELSTFESGDRIFLYSDGIPECFNAAEEPYSEERLLDRLRQWRDMPLQELLKKLEDDLRTWRNDEDFSDDLTLLAIEMD
ncbi:MAG: SpoIIE family protein phosphatase [Candidatus Latescibacteria bacterium]|jgi:phosphoserine phosphatase RsbU/P|nr:SpoIIE family protein phosphatase [Candidatus Latescibacterota bacterium]